MVKPFYNRDDESRRLERFIETEAGALAVVYGRRRCGKSTLLQRVLSGPHVYFQADQRETVLQLEAFAGAIGQKLVGFDKAEYRTWDALISSVVLRVDERLMICIDEFPYLVQSDPSLPSVMQRFIDRPESRIGWILCGSSQRMMHGLVLDKRAPLYGRAREILKIEPLAPGWVMKALQTGAVQAVDAYSVWGGVPRYWELAAEYSRQEEAMEDLVWNPRGILHDEPGRLLLDDLRSAVQPYSILSLIGMGCHRPSEIAARMGKPLSGLARPLAQLCELGYVRRDVPFGESSKKSRRALYRLKEPFLRFFFQFVLPHESSLAQGLMRPARDAWRRGRSQHVASCWEDLCRLAVPWLPKSEIAWGPASAWWADTKMQTEIDIVATSLDKKSLLVGECKWSNRKKRIDLDAMDRQLRRKAGEIPTARGKRIVTSCWLGGSVEATGCVDLLLAPEEVMGALKR